VADDDLFTGGAGEIVLTAHGGVDGVQQLAHRNRGGPQRVGALVIAAEGDDQPLGGGQQRVEQQLTVLAARVALAQVRVLQHEIVAVARGLARERAVVEPEQAHDAVRHRAHRLKGAHGQVTGAEVRPGGAPRQAVGQERAHLGGGELWGGRAVGL
jgi:hypothetical protein